MRNVVTFQYHCAHSLTVISFHIASFEGHSGCQSEATYGLIMLTLRKMFVLMSTIHMSKYRMMDNRLKGSKL